MCKIDIGEYSLPAHVLTCTSTCADQTCIYLNSTCVYFCKQWIPGRNAPNAAFYNVSGSALFAKTNSTFLEKNYMFGE